MPLQQTMDTNWWFSMAHPDSLWLIADAVTTLWVTFELTDDLLKNMVVNWLFQGDFLGYLRLYKFYNTLGQPIPTDQPTNKWVQ